jgi:CHAT domain-containing protein/tetratricopeptide (TPR) repeat protein
MARRRFVILTLAAIAWAALVGCRAYAEDDLVALNAEVQRLYFAGKYVEATAIAKRLLAIREKALGLDHPDVATSLNNLGELYRLQGRFAEAEPLHLRSLAIREQRLGSNHPLVALSLNSLGELYRAQGRYKEAEPLLRRAITTYEVALGRDNRAVATPANNLASLYQIMGRYSEAETLFKRASSILEATLGARDLQFATALNNLASLYQDQGRFAEAELLFQRSLTIHEEVVGANHLDTGMAYNNLALLYHLQGRNTEAEALFRRSLPIVETVLGPEHTDVVIVRNNIAELFVTQRRYSEAEALFENGIAILKRTVGPSHVLVGLSLNKLADTYEAQGRHTDAEQLFRSGLAIIEAALGPGHAHVAGALGGLASVYRMQGRYTEAEPLFKRAISISEGALGPNHPLVSSSLSNLAVLYHLEGRYSDAVPLHKRTLSIRETSLGPDHPEVATTLNYLADTYKELGLFAEAEPLYKRSLAIRERVGPEHLDTGQSLNSMALLYQSQGRNSEAEPLLRRALAIAEKLLGSEHLYVAQSLNNLAVVYQTQGRYSEAEPLLQRSLAIRQAALRPEHPDVGQSLNNLAALAYFQSNWQLAADYWRRSTAVIKHYADSGLVRRQRDSSEGLVQRLAWQLRAFIKSTYQLASHGDVSTAALGFEMFEVAQWAQTSEAAVSFTQMAARSAGRSPQLAGLVRERQDLVGEWQRLDNLLIYSKSEPVAKRKVDVERAEAARLQTIEMRVADIDRQFKKDFPDYAALTSMAPLTVEEIQAQLREDEALVLFLDTPEWKPLPDETFVWALTKTGARWLRSDLGMAALGRDVAALRCGLDATRWEDEEGSARCRRLVEREPRRYVNGTVRAETLPFDHARALKLYTALFSKLEDLIRGKHLLIVPAGPLTQLPFQVLVTKLPASNDHRQVDWLAREHSITTLPAVSSLRSLRSIGGPSAASKPMIGFGNPLLVGSPSDARDVMRAKLAREKQNCPERRSDQIAALTEQRSGMVGVKTRRGLVDTQLIKIQPPLPETADELCAVARDAKAGPRDVRLGARATEREIKRLSSSGELAKYRMLHFATHGVLAGQLDATHEPGLILTPPDRATDEDDGYLSASEIAALKLDADWVILSACNTAAGGAASAEALSGLARAFIYAQARALLVSHWEVYSNATVKLITTAIGEMARDPKVGRSEALRRAMLALIDKGEPHEAHPAYWAPFVVVGEGAAAR